MVFFAAAAGTVIPASVVLLTDIPKTGFLRSPKTAFVLS